MLGRNFLSSLNPFYKCWLCDDWHFKNKTTYKVVLRNDLNHEKAKYICNPCGDAIDARYQAGLDIANSTPDWQMENEFGEE